jgi:hypothetical protein
MSKQELVTGHVPFNEIKSDPAVIGAVMQGKRPNRPSILPVESTHGEAFWHILEKCWKQESENRPSAMEVQSMVRLNNNSICLSNANDKIALCS